MNYIDINKNQLENMIKENKNIKIIDIRDKEEYNEFSIDNSINIPLAELLFNMDELEEYRENDIVVCCSSGIRSTTACNLLLMEGYENIYNLEKGMSVYTG